MPPRVHKLLPFLAFLLATAVTAGLAAVLIALSRPSTGAAAWAMVLALALGLGAFSAWAIRTRLALEAATDGQRALCTALPDLVLLLDADGRCVDSFGGSRGRRSDYLGRPVTELLPGVGEERALRSIEEAMHSGNERRLEYSHRSPGGRPQPVQWFEARVVPVGQTAAAPAGVLWVAHDITRRKRVEEELRLAAQVFETSREAIIVTDASHRILSVNAAFTRISGFPAAEVLGKNPSMWSSGLQSHKFYQEMRRALQEEGHWNGELWNRRKSGEIFAQHASISAVRDEAGRTTHYVAIMSDITERKAAEEQIRRLALYDTLTGLGNRALLGTRIEQALAEARREGRHPAVLFIDLDDFKPINDSLGHEAGDRVLQELAQRLRHSVREVDTVARLGGDEFVVLLTGPVDHVGAQQVAAKLLREIAVPFTLGGRGWRVGASIGIALFPQHGTDLDGLLRAADDAMYLAKGRGKNTFCIAPAPTSAG